MSNPVPILTETGEDPTYFKDRYPTLPELLRAGGLTGVEYCLVSGQNMKKFAKMADERGCAWSPIRDLPALTISGPKGTVETVVLMGRGEPIKGAGDYNGVRQYFVDVDLEEAVGIPAGPDSPIAKAKEAPASAPQKGKVQESHQ